MSLYISDLVQFYVQIATLPTEKRSPPSAKIEILSSLSFWKVGRRFNSHPAERGMHTIRMVFAFWQTAFLIVGKTNRRGETVRFRGFFLETYLHHRGIPFGLVLVLFQLRYLRNRPVLRSNSVTYVIIPFYVSVSFPESRTFFVKNWSYKNHQNRAKKQKKPKKTPPL